MGLVTIHLVVGVGILIFLFLCFFSYSTVMSLANLYIIVGAISFVTSIVTAIVLVTKFINQPVAHGFFSYSDILASALFSLGMLLDGLMFDGFIVPCYQYALVYSLFIVPIVTSFFSVLGMAIERFQAFAVYRDTGVISKKFSIAWFVASWLISICFVVILLGQLKNKDVDSTSVTDPSKQISGTRHNFVLASQIFPGPHSQTLTWSGVPIIPGQEAVVISSESNNYYNSSVMNSTQTLSENFSAEFVIDEGFLPEDNREEFNLTFVENINNTQSHSPIRELLMINEDLFPDDISQDVAIVRAKMITRNINSSDCERDQNAVCIEPPPAIKSTNMAAKEPLCAVKSEKFIMYFFTLLFLLCFVTPVLITTSLNVYITSAVRGTQYDNISNHQWLTLVACVVMWCPCLLERMLSKWGLLTDRLPVAVFLFLLGHTHNLLRCVLHAVFAQQSFNNQRPGSKLVQIARKVSWTLPTRSSKVRPLSDRKVTVNVVPDPPPPACLARKNTLTPRAPCIGMSSTPQPTRRATIPIIPNITVVETSSV